MSKIVIDRAVVEQALDVFERGRFANKDVDELEALCDVLRAALVQPQVEQSSVVGVIGWKNQLPNSGTVVHWTALMPPLGTKLYTHPQNLRCKSTQARLATLWGYEKPQPTRQPLTDEQIAQAVRWMYQDHRAAEMGLQDDIAVARAIERAHGIGGEA